jgi:tetratricopeptide (TPR) repeat protein
MMAWIGEAQAGTHHLADALKSYEKAAADLAADQANFDDARCHWAMVETKIGNTLVKMGRLHEARAVFMKAIEISNLPLSREHMDIPALYAAADGYAGLGDVAAAEARKTPDPTLRSRLLNDARTSYINTLSAREQIPNQSRLTGNGYLARDPSRLNQQPAALPR